MFYLVWLDSLEILLGEGMLVAADVHGQSAAGHVGGVAHVTTGLTHQESLPGGVHEKPHVQPV